jgi:uncharacterized coiled-coil protein SlyX
MDEDAVERSFESTRLIKDVLSDILGKCPAGTVVTYKEKEYGFEDPISFIPFVTGDEIALTSPYDLHFEVRNDMKQRGRFVETILHPKTSLENIPLDDFPELFGDLICMLWTKSQPEKVICSTDRFYALCSACDKLVLSQHPFRTCRFQRVEQCRDKSYCLFSDVVELSLTVDQVIEKIRPPDLVNRDFLLRVGDQDLLGSLNFVQTVPRDSVVQFCLLERKFVFTLPSGKSFQCRFGDSDTIENARQTVLAFLKDPRLSLEQIEIVGHSDNDTRLSTLYRRGISLNTNIKDPLYDFGDPIGFRRFPHDCTIPQIVGTLGFELEKRVILNIPGHDAPKQTDTLYDLCRGRRLTVTIELFAFTVCFPDGVNQTFSLTPYTTVSQFISRLFIVHEGNRQTVRYADPVSTPTTLKVFKPELVHVRVLNDSHDLPPDSHLAAEVRPDQALVLVLTFDCEVICGDEHRQVPYKQNISPTEFEVSASQLFGFPVSLSLQTALSFGLSRPIFVSRKNSNQSVPPPQSPEPLVFVGSRETELLERISEMEERLGQSDRQIVALQRQVKDQQITIQKMAQALARVEVEVRRLPSTET